MAPDYTDRADAIHANPARGNTSEAVNLSLVALGILPAFGDGPRSKIAHLADRSLVYDSVVPTFRGRLYLDGGCQNSSYPSTCGDRDDARTRTTGRHVL